MWIYCVLKQHQQNIKLIDVETEPECTKYLSRQTSSFLNICTTFVLIVYGTHSNYITYTSICMQPPFQTAVVDL